MHDLVIDKTVFAADQIWIITDYQLEKVLAKWAKEIRDTP